MHASWIKYAVGSIGVFCFCASMAGPQKGRIEGPPGNGWKAKVVKLIAKDHRGIQVQLVQKVRACMYAANEGKEGQTFDISIETHQRFKVGETVDVWVYPKAKATTRLPECE